jgi:hypothetical protein
VPTEQENKAIFRRYLEEVGNQATWSLLAGSSTATSPTSLTRQPSSVAPSTSSGFEPRNMRLSQTCASASRTRSQKGTSW